MNEQAREDEQATYAKALVDHDAVAGDSAYVGDLVPAGETTGRGGKHQGANKVSKAGEKAEKVACRPDEVGR